MGIPGGANLLLAAGGVSTYEIDQSLRFDGSSYLSRTPSSSGNRRSWSLSVWLKFDRAGEKANNNTEEFPFMWAGNYNRLQLSGSRLGTTPAGTLGPNLLYDYVTNRGYIAAGFRDPSAWFHVVFAYDANNGTNTERARYYVNGVRQNWANTTGGWGNQDSLINSNTTHWIGTNNSQSSLFYTGYMAEYHFINGTSVTDASDFGEYDDNGVWRPIPYTGSYGTNGFYLKFDPSASNGIGHDHSGNGNHWTATNFDTSGSTGSSSSDVVTDSPTNNFAVLNRAMKRQDRDLEDCVKEAGLRFKKGDGNNQYIASSIACPGSGKWYFEFTVNTHQLYVGVAEEGTWSDVLGVASNSVVLQMDSSSNYYIRNYYTSSTQNLSGEASNGQVYSMRYDADNGTVAFYNASGTQFGSTVTGLTTGVERFFFISGQSGADSYCNFGQQDWAHTLPSGYKALCTANLPAPDIADGSQNMTPVLWTGTGSARTQGGYNFQPDLLWIMCRSASGMSVRWHDVVRGDNGTVMYRLQTNANNSEDTDTDVTGLTSTGFTIGNNGTDHPNISGRTYVGWGWKAAENSGSSNTSGSITSTVSANPSAGFSIVSWTGTSSVQTVGHGLGVTPAMIVVKNRDHGYDWYVGHKDLTSYRYRLSFNLNNGEIDSASAFNSTSPTSTVFTVGNNLGSNGSGDKMIAYCFAEVEGYSKFGKYTGNGSYVGAFQYCGFKPAFVMVKCSSTSGDDWKIWDKTRPGYNLTNLSLATNTTAQEDTSPQNSAIDIYSNGFQLRSLTTSTNGNGRKYAFMAFASHPFGGDGVSPATAR